MSGSETDPYDPALRALIAGAFSRLEDRLRVATPALATPTLTWTRVLAGGKSPDEYFTHRLAFPMLLLPWWLEEVIHGEHDDAFQSDVIYAAVTGYYFVRMIDDLMDRDRQIPAVVLPALVFFHTELARTCQAHFGADDPFWVDFESVSFASADTAALDAELHAIDRQTFMAISSRKVVGAKMPLAAVCARYRRRDLLPAWSELIDLLGRWHQMLNDLLGWSRDLADGRATYFLSEAARRKRPDEPVEAWIVREGLTWGVAELEAWLRPLHAATDRLGHRPLRDYIETRHRDARERWTRVLPALRELERFMATRLD